MLKIMNPIYRLPPNLFKTNFYMILGKWPTWRTIIFYLFISILYVFRATQCSSSGESIVSVRHLVYVTLSLNDNFYIIVFIKQFTVGAVTLLPHCRTAPGGSGPPLYRGSMITLRHNTVGGISLDGWSDRRRYRYLTSHNTDKRQTDIHAPGGIRTHNPSKQAATDPRFT